MKNKLFIKTLLIVLSLALVFTSVVSCGNKEKDKETSKETSSLSDTDSSAQITNNEDESSSEPASADSEAKSTEKKSSKSSKSKNKTGGNSSSANGSSSSGTTSSAGKTPGNVTPNKPSNQTGTNEVTVPENWEYDEETPAAKIITPVVKGDGADIYTEWPQGFSK